MLISPYVPDRRCIAGFIRVRFLIARRQPHIIGDEKPLRRRTRTPARLGNLDSNQDGRCQDTALTALAATLLLESFTAQRFRDNNSIAMTSSEAEFIRELEIFRDAGGRADL